MTTIRLERVSTLLTTHPTDLPRLVRAAGWLTSCRVGKRVGFLSLSDGSGPTPLQVVLPDDVLTSQPALRALTPGCSVSVSGTLIASQGAGQSVELQATHVLVHGLVHDPKTYPIQPKAQAPDFLRTVPHLRVRTPLMGSVARLRHALAQGLHEFFAAEGFLWVATPILTASDAEGAGARFRVVAEASGSSGEFFGTPAYLTVSGQLAGESLCAGLSRVYTFGPTFRAEQSQTSRHLAEFWMLEPEMAFAGLADIQHLSESMLKHAITHCLASIPGDMAVFAASGAPCAADWHAWCATPFGAIPYSEAIKLLERSGQFDGVTWGMDLQSVHERWLVAQVGRPLFVTDYPTALKSFYMKASTDGRTVEAVDLLVPGMGEIIGGSVREDDHDRLVERMRALGLDPDDYASYLDLRRYGSVPHAGFGLGFERLVAYVAGLPSVRDAIAFPRYAGHIGE